MAPPKRPVMERFAEKLSEGGDCWIWTGGIDSDGYGRFWVDGKTRMAHRVSFELHIYEIPDGLTLDHLCRQKSCVNPWHLEPVPSEVNISRANSAITHCVSGHKFTPENTEMDRGRRRCRECGRRRSREYQRRKARERVGID